MQFQTTTIFYLEPPPLLHDAGDSEMKLRAELGFNADDRLYVCFHNLHKFGVTAFDETVKKLLARDLRFGSRVVSVVSDFS